MDNIKKINYFTLEDLSPTDGLIIFRYCGKFIVEQRLNRDESIITANLETYNTISKMVKGG